MYIKILTKFLSHISLQSHLEKIIEKPNEMQRRLSRSFNTSDSFEDKVSGHANHWSSVIHLGVTFILIYIFSKN